MTVRRPAPAWDELMISLGLAPSASTPAEPARPSCTCSGNRTAYQQHRRRGEEPCPQSRAANTVYLRNRNGGAARSAPQCGTYSGYNAHTRAGEKPCEACAEARRVRDRKAYAARKQAAA